MKELGSRHSKYERYGIHFGPLSIGRSQTNSNYGIFHSMVYDKEKGKEKALGCQPFSQSPF